MDQLKEFVICGKTKDAETKLKELIDSGTSPARIMNDSLIPAMDVVGDKFQNGEYFLPEMLVAAQVMHICLKILKPALTVSNTQPIGKAIIGTVKGDFHDIGKNLVGISLEGSGFEVIDLGVDVTPEKFVEAVKQYSPKVIGMSALLTTTMQSMHDVIESLKNAGLRSSVKVMVGGAAIQQKFADRIGADYYGPDSTAAKDYARSIV
ncbi:MAG: corrinoid protein [Syntrophales bacterium]|jgi:5-methyltetrahydrofolate--homocysteine methyltransferase